MSGTNTSRDSGATVFDDPVAVANVVLDLARPLLIVFDCDGVLAPITDHADDSELTPGVGRSLVELADFDEVLVAILSGRSLAGLEQFGFDDTLIVAGSYGGERRGRPPEPLTAPERERLDAIDDILKDAASIAGPGAWIERKPTSSVLHVREADADRGRAAIDHTHDRQRALTGHECHDGAQVVELMARPTNKGKGVRSVRADFAPRSTVYVGDDVPDEDAFAELGPNDAGIKVGEGVSLAQHRLGDPAAVATFLQALTRNYR